MNASEIELIDVDLFTDGGADPNPGKGAWAVMLRAKGKYKDFS
jgi:ribonuclease HI